MALACGGADFLPHIPCKLQQLLWCADTPLHINFVVANHYDPANERHRPHQSGSGIEIDNRGNVRALAAQECCLLPSDIPIRKLALGTGNGASHLVLGYGSELKAHDGPDDFDFTNPFHRVTRFHSLFHPQARTTDPAAFLKRLHYKGIMVSRFPAKHTLQRLCRDFKELLAIDTGRWQERTCDFEQEWGQLHPWQKRAAIPIIDVVRHMMDASPHSGYPLDKPGVVLLDRPDLFLSNRVFPLWITLMDRLLPQIQFVLTLSLKTQLDFPRSAQRSRLDLPVSIPRKVAKTSPRLPTSTVLLVDVDSRLPNLALMKLGRHFKDQGRRVVLARKACRVKGPDQVYASCVFFSPASQGRVEQLRRFYGKSLTIGGSGVDPKKRLPRKIEDLPAEYSLYPELNDRAIGFLTRGCSGNCSFCIVPIKEGKPRQVSDLDDLLQNQFRKLILLDDNLLAHPKSGVFLEEMARRDLQVNFNQTLDIRYLDRVKSRLLRRVRSSNITFSRSVYHFSLNDTRHLDLVERKYRQAGFERGDNVEFICMYGFNTTLAEDVERFRFLRSLPGAYVFVQEYQPHINGKQPDLSGFFDERADKLIDELITIMFTQNMKSMETYYRWLSKRYARSFGKLHRGLVDTIFRYNQRHRKGRYITSLAGTI